jgi:hypothetical protein
MASLKKEKIVIQTSDLIHVALKIASLQPIVPVESESCAVMKEM